MNTRKRTLSLLLVLAMLTLAFAAFFPATVAADDPPAEIQDFEYQTSKNFAVAGATTELRFVFTIGSLHYTKAGFVFSFENYDDDEENDIEEPAIGAEHCYVVEATTAYKTINADGKAQPAPDGRWWVAVKVTNIPQDEYNCAIHVRAFVKDEEGTRYSVAKVIDPFTAHREGGTIREYVGTKSGTEYSDLRNVWTDVLQSGAKTFCPTQENPAGNDLYIEYSVLFSKYLTDEYLKSTAGANVTSGVANGTSMHYALMYWDPCDKKTDFGFQSTGNFTTLASEDPGFYPNIVKKNPTLADLPHVGGDDANNPDYGWHRIGIVYHEEVTNKAALENDAVAGATPAEYYLTVSLYIDGNLVSVLCSTDNLAEDSNNYDLKLYTAESDGNGGIVYTDVAETERDQSVYVYRLRNFQYVSSGKVPCCVFADASATCGRSFAQRVTQVDTYSDLSAYKFRTFKYSSTNKKLIDAPLYYRIINDSSFPGAISVMSYNVGVYGGKSGDAMWEGRDPEKVAETILSESPDIVGLQEVNQNNNDHGWNDTLDSLASSGGYTRLTGEYTTDGFEKNEILFKTDKFTLKSEGTMIYKTLASSLNVSNTEDANQSLDAHGRAFHYAVLQEIASGKKILVVNTHLHYIGTGSGYEEHDKVRRYEIRTLLAWLETQRATYPDQIVMGDMNSHYKTGQGKVNMELFTDDGFERTNSAAVASVRGDVYGTLVKPVDETNRAAQDEWIFDYILTKGNIKTAYYTVVLNPIDEGGTYPSDHLPILAKIYLR